MCRPIRVPEFLTGHGQGIPFLGRQNWTKMGIIAKDIATKILPENCFGPYSWFNAKKSSYCATDERMRGQSMRSRDQTDWWWLVHCCRPQSPHRHYINTGTRLTTRRRSFHGNFGSMETMNIVKISWTALLASHKSEVVRWLVVCWEFDRRKSVTECSKYFTSKSGFKDTMHLLSRPEFAQFETSFALQSCDSDGGTEIRCKWTLR